MENFIIIAISILSGVFLKKFRALPKDSHKIINLWIIYVALPAITLHNIPKMQWNLELLLPIAMPLIVFIAAFLFIQLLGRFMYLGKSLKGALLLTIGFSNLSFLGFPLTEAYYGKQGLQLAILCDQVGFITLSSLGIITASYASATDKSDFSGISILKKLIIFPPTIAFVLALVLPKIVNFNGIAIDVVLKSFGGTMVPMALFSVGMQLQFKHWKSDKLLLVAALSYKLFLAPLLIMLISGFFIIDKFVIQVSVLEAAMAPMVTSVIVATEFGLKPKLCSMILSFGIPISFITTYLWYYFL
ncbi:AEC family transporter [Aquimarina agarivorans]|uniref:AEC family transporter n=1 Tax=Aquimarina agarivorans TaxID=980584 RepID=UPI000248E61C|nr:AEC family transporter [Aquimarina agarivorans]